MEYFSEKNNIFQIDFEYEDYYLLKDNIIYKVLVEKYENEIKIIIKNYKIELNLKNASLLFKKEFESIYKAYIFIKNAFEENKVIIKNVINNKEIKLDIKICNENIKEIILSYNEINKNKNYIINKTVNEINNLKNTIKDLINENVKLKKEINILKSYHDKPKHIKLITDIKKDCYACTNLDNIFTAFKSVQNSLYIIYSNKNKSLICYDIVQQKIITEIKNAHNKYISNIKHFYDKTNKIDLIMSISFKDNNIKLWNVYNWKCILNLQNVNSNGFLDSACFLSENNSNYILTSNCYWGGPSEYIKIFDFNGNKIKEINNSNEKTYFIDSFYDNLINKNYIITGNENHVKSYDYEKNILYHKYYDNDNRGHFSIVISNNDNIIKLIESCFDGKIRIWNFHYGLLLNKINISNRALFGICLLKNNYLLVGCEDKTIKLIELLNGTVIQSLNIHNKWVISIKKINHQKYGEFIISQGYDNDQIKIWLNINKF